jgi:benzaldehyde dehydrogenase (NAD)
MSLLEKSAWQGKIFSNGWVSGSGGEYPVTEPAIGGVMGALGAATLKDVAAAGKKAAEAQNSHG